MALRQHRIILTAAVFAAVVPFSALAQGLPMPPMKGGYELELRGEVVPKRATIIGAEISGRVDKLPYRFGERFKEGDLLASIDCAITASQLDRAKAVLGVARRLQAANKRLHELNSIGSIEMESAAAEEAKAAAEVAVLETTLSKCSIRAPFSGKIVELKLREHQYAQIGQPLVEIIDDSTFEIEFIAPSRFLKQISAGTDVSMRIDETGELFSATVETVAAKVDSVSQTVKFVARLNPPLNTLKAGMSGQIFISDPNKGSTQ